MLNVEPVARPRATVGHCGCGARVGGPEVPNVAKSEDSTCGTSVVAFALRPLTLPKLVATVSSSRLEMTACCNVVWLDLFNLKRRSCYVSQLATLSLL